MGEKWEKVSGRISKSGEASEGLSSIRFEPDDKIGSRIVRIFRNPLPLYGHRIRVRLDVKAGKSNKFVFLFIARNNGKWQKVEPGIVRYTYTDNVEWVTLSEDFAITSDIDTLIFNLWLQAGAREPAFVDNLSINVID